MPNIKGLFLYDTHWQINKIVLMQDMSRIRSMAKNDNDWKYYIGPLHINRTVNKLHISITKNEPEPEIIIYHYTNYTVSDQWQPAYWKIKIDWKFEKSELEQHMRQLNGTWAHYCNYP